MGSFIGESLQIENNLFIFVNPMWYLRPDSDLACIRIVSQVYIILNTCFKCINTGDL